MRFTRHMQAAVADAPFPLLLVYDDSLHNRWTAESTNGAAFTLNSREDVGRLPNGDPVPCGRSLAADFTHGEQSLTLRTSEAVIVPNGTSLLLSVAFKLLPIPSTTATRSADCRLSVLHGSATKCNTHVCLAARSKRVDGDSLLYAPLCGPEMADANGWRQAHIPLAALDARDTIVELRIVRGSEVSGPGVLRVHLDEIWIAMEHSPRAGELTPSYGRTDINAIRQQWLQGVRPSGAANVARNNRNPHFCEYMSSELGQKKSADRPLCRMDGDHLDGRWLQTCDPRLIRRPDHFAYQRALPTVLGWYDYRVCFRQSATERLRTLQALTWSWRPKSCALAPVRGDAFTKWLGGRTVLFVGDSLSAQTYYSLLWLLGEAVESHSDVVGVAPEERQRGHQRAEQTMGTCESSVGNEGGFLSEARLRGGGRLVKILRWTTLIDELYNLKDAWWKPWLESADIVVLNVGHHYHVVDKGFHRYDKLARVGARALESLMKPSAQLIFRTTNVGNIGCENASRPMRSRRDAWALLSEDEDVWMWQPKRSGSDFFKDKYSWRGPPIFEHAWAAAASTTRSLGPRFTFLNVSFLDARADGHVASAMRYSSASGRFGNRQKVDFPLDCLHYCYPGPTDYWALSLYNLLLNNARYVGAGTGSVSGV